MKARGSKPAVANSVRLGYLAACREDCRLVAIVRLEITTFLRHGPNTGGPRPEFSYWGRPARTMSSVRNPDSVQRPSVNPP